MKWMNVLNQEFLPQESSALPEKKPQGEEPIREEKPRGLSRQEVLRRKKEYGENVLVGKRKKHAVILFFEQYKDIMTMILLVCTAASVFMGEYVEAITIAVIVLMNGFLGFLQERKTERTLESLQAMAAPHANVFRDGVLCRQPASELVPGDLVLIEAGDRIPADGTLVSSVALSCDESMLTGESVAVKKGEEERSVYMGCTVVGGRGEFLVEHTGMRTKMGQIAGMLSQISEEPTPLQKHLAGLSKYIAAGCLLICAIVSITGVLRGEDLFSMLITGVSLAVAAVPEGLCAVVTISLALAVSRMVKQNALVRKLHAVETLGCATVIRSDKTGTITKNQMSVHAFSTMQTKECEKPDRSDEAIEQMLLCFRVCTAVQDDAPTHGSATEQALYRCASAELTEKPLMTKVAEIPFDSTRKRMSVLMKTPGGGYTLYAKGAPDVLLSRCSSVQVGSRIVPLGAVERAQLVKQNGVLADRAMRVIGAAYRQAFDETDTAEEGLVFLGFAGLTDPPRDGVKQAVFRGRQAGIKTVMITGDHKNTAAAIAKQTGILTEGERVVTGAELDRMDDSTLRNTVMQTSVFARVSPEHKLRIVRAFKQRGQITAMTGDGVNDAPAVKEADIGVSMGKTGTDVTKEAADMILLDDDFSTMMTAVAEGRSIYANIRKFIRYLLSCNIGEVLTMFLGMLFSMPVILLPIQILLVNLVTDGLPAIALGLEPYDQNVMKKPPRKPEESIFSNGLGFRIIMCGILIGLTTLGSFVCVYRMTGDVTHARTAALFSLIFAQLLHVFECKTEEGSIFSISFFNNKKLIAAAAVSVTVLFCVMYIPWLQMIFSTVSLSFEELLWPMLFCLAAPVLRAAIHR